MHELGVLCHAVKTVSEIAEKNKIKCIKFMTLEVGESSSFVPAFLEKLFPVATENFPLLKNAQLRIRMAPGNGLIIKEIGY
ncbi:MAG: hydrogenase maturation nickel metallochaperone HypA [Clostridia bacterium]|nr:hydrogenase maturation nickel metallochaperone HypA [Clostridia bacterium]